MASKLEFDSMPPPAPGGGRRLEFDSPAPAGPPRVPISTDNSGAAPAPAAPISTGNIDTTGMPEDPKVTEQKKSAARIQAIARSLEAGRPYTPGITDHIADSATLSTARPISAAVGAGVQGLLNSYPGSNYEERYKANTRYMNTGARQAEENTGPLAPLVGAAASLPASMAATPFRAATAVPAATTRTVAGQSSVAPASTTKVMGQSAVPGFIEGASQNAESVEGAIKGGATNAALSAAASGVADKVSQYALPASRRGAAAEAQAAKGVDPASLKDAADTFYKQMDNAGVRYDAQQTAPLYQALHDMRNAARYDANANPTLSGHFDRLMNLSRNEMSYTELQNLRSAVADQTRSPDPSTRRAAGEMVGHVDRVIRSAPAINPQGLDMANLHQEAGRLWRGSNLAADIDYRAGKAGRMEEAGKNINPDAKMRDELFNYRERTRGPRAYNPLGDKGNTANALLDRAIEGTTGQNIKRRVGDFLVNGGAKGAGALFGAGTTALGLTHGNAPGYALISAAAGLPVWGAGHATGKALQNSAAGARGRDADALLRNITGSPTLPKGAAIDREDLAKILFSQDLSRIAPRVGSAVIGEKKEDKEKKK